jgi:hypothetical protein
MPALAKAYVQRPTLRPTDFLIGERAHETRYVPSSLVPAEIVGTIYPNKLQLDFRYISFESPAAKKFSLDDVEIVLGKFTGKILTIIISFEPNYEKLVASFDVAAHAVRKARAKLEKESTQKSYDLISYFLSQAKLDFQSEKMKKELEAAWFAKNARDN